MSSIATYDAVQAELEERRRRVQARHVAPPAMAGPGITFVATVDIARPPEDVFGYVADLTRLPSWNYWVRSVRQVTPGPVRVGTVFHQVRRNDQQHVRIAVHEAPHRIALATLDGSRPRFTRDIRLRPTGDGGTQLVDRWQLDTGHPAAVQRLLARRIRTGVTDNLTRLSELLETGQTVLPDGRPVRWSGADPTTA